jgi:hypothetical protein
VVEEYEEGEESILRSELNKLYVRFEFSTTVKMMVWILTPCSCVGDYQRFRGTFSLHSKGRSEHISMKIVWYVT